MAKRKKKKRSVAKPLSIVHDGTLTQAEALQALAAAAQAATEALPEALAKCKTDEDKQKVQTDRDTVVLAYLNSLNKSLINTSSQFEAMANQLTDEAAAVGKRVTTLKNVSEAIT